MLTHNYRGSRREAIFTIYFKVFGMAQSKVHVLSMCILALWFLFTIKVNCMMKMIPVCICTQLYTTTCIHTCTFM